MKQQVSSIEQLIENVKKTPPYRMWKTEQVVYLLEHFKNIMIQNQLREIRHLNESK